MFRHATRVYARIPRGGARFGQLRFNATAAASSVPGQGGSAVDTARPPFFSPAPGDTKPFYITTPIFYVNASPHVGHLHTVVLTDVFARFARLRHPDREVYFLTGTDEHGLKIQQAAAKAGKPELEFCDEVSQRFRDLAAKANISNTVFMRTTEPRHYTAVQTFWNKLVDSGDVYKGSHSGWYSVSDECFFTDSQVEQENGRMIAVETGNEVTWQEEENWKFRLGNYGDKLREWYGKEETVSPQKYKDDLIKQLDTLGDLSISRPSSRVKWGIPVPNDPGQTIYVWVEALLNYLTAAGYPGERPSWPADMHVVGKDIIRFHAQHWPALLMAAGEHPPRRVLAHAHWTMHRAKMSKSRGNVADPIAAMDKYGVDGVRWYLMRAGGSLADDADYSDVELASAYARLSDQVGNLVSRISSKGILKRMGPWEESDRDEALDEALATLREDVEGKFENYDLVRACARILEVVNDVNKYFTLKQPWAAENSTGPVMYAYAALRLTGILAQPVIPTKAVELLDRLGVPADERGWANAVWDPAQVDAAAVKERLGAAGKKYKGTTLFPRVEE